jgi:hypothetical protein
MASVMKDRFQRPGEAARLGIHLPFFEMMSTKAKGEVFIKVEELQPDGSVKVLDERHLKNTICADASILAAIYFKDKDSRIHSANMLAIGTGATGALLSPDAPDPDQRSLNSEVQRKPWSSTIYRDGSGNAVAIPTNIVDFTVTYDEAEAVGPLNEMGIMSTISANPLIQNENPDTYPTRDLTRDLTQYDVLVNYLSFSVISKPSTARLTITWRITF